MSFKTNIDTLGMEHFFLEIFVIFGGNSGVCFSFLVEPLVCLLYCKDILKKNVVGDSCRYFSCVSVLR